MHAHASPVLAEIAERLAAIVSAADIRGEQVLPPLLILGTSERVGSNWLSDTLRPELAQHNEPFRQQLGQDHPWSALNSRSAGPGGVLPGRLGRHWLVSFAVAKYGPIRQVVKETNLFFALPTLLALLPEAPILVLSRSPLGVASSFTRGDLFRRWGYQSRYEQMVFMTRHGTRGMCQFAPLVPDDDPPDLVALVRLQVLNTVLIAAALDGRHPAHVAYEDAVTRPADALAALTAALPELQHLTLSLDRQPGARPNGDDTFATTNPKTTLTAAVTPAEAKVISAASAASLAVARAVLPGPVVATAESWLSGDYLYRLGPSQPRRNGREPSPSGRPGRVASRFVRRGDLEVRNVLVSNAEYTGFLNVLADAGMPNCHSGIWLLACEMPHERGGRLHLDSSATRWTVSPGYEYYPAYWVTWIGAAAFAAWTGTRLPSRAELIQLTRNTVITGNAAYRAGDVAPVTEPGLAPGAIHHLLGNLQLWCVDGPDTHTGPGGSATRWLYGTAWNTPATREAAQQPRSRHILGCSRGIGIRLVHDGTQRPISAAELARRLAAWISALDDRSRPLAETDQHLIGALGCSQTDARLGAHIAARPRESVRG